MHNTNWFGVFAVAIFMRRHPWNCGYSRQSPGRTVLASKWNGPLRRALKKRRYNKRFVQSAHFCEWRLLRFIS
jgi:hypothetical protein